MGRQQLWTLPMKPGKGGAHLDDPMVPGKVEKSDTKDLTADDDTMTAHKSGRWTDRFLNFAQ